MIARMKKLFLPLVAVLLQSVMYAKSVTVQVLQSSGYASPGGVRPGVSIVDTAPDVCEETFVIEDAVMNTMFDAGHIVTNIEPRLFDNEKLSGGKSLQPTLLKAMNYALKGGSKYFVQFTVRYKPLVGDDAPKSPEAVLMANIEGIDWAVYDTVTRQRLSDGSEKAAVPKKDGAESVVAYAAKVAKSACTGIK